MSLRITIHDEQDTLTMQLEGSLAGPNVRILEDCWEKAIAGGTKQKLCVDLKGVTYIDDAGEARLAAMHAHGAALVATHALTKGIVAEITGKDLPQNR